MRAVVADGDIVGFVMLALPTEHHEHPYLWRLLIDRRQIAVDLLRQHRRIRLIPGTGQL